MLILQKVKLESNIQENYSTGSNILGSDKGVKNKK